MQRLLTLLLAGIFSHSVSASGYDIQIYPLSFDSIKQTWSIGQGKPVTDREGYDNQASFTQDSKGVVFASDRSGAFNDIYRYDVKNGKTTQLTQTPKESEFSPIDTANGLQYVVEQGVPHQSVWLQKGSAPRIRAINSLIPAGYYATHSKLGTLIWARYAYSLYFEPQGGNANEGHFVVANAGRSIHVVPETNLFSFVHKTMDGDRAIKTFNPNSKQQQTLVSLGAGSEDYAWGSIKGSGFAWVFNVENGVLRSWMHKKNDNNVSKNSWVPVANLTPPTLLHKSANRISISPDNRYMTIVWSRK